MSEAAKPIGDSKSIEAYLYKTMSKLFQRDFETLRLHGLGLSAHTEAMVLKAVSLHCKEMAKTPLISGEQFVKEAMNNRMVHAMKIITQKPELGAAMAELCEAQRRLKATLS